MFNPCTLTPRDPQRHLQRLGHICPQNPKTPCGRMRENKISKLKKINTMNPSTVRASLSSIPVTPGPTGRNFEKGPVSFITVQDTLGVLDFDEDYHANCKQEIL